MRLPLLLAAFLLAACGGAGSSGHASFADLRSRPLPHLTSGGCHSDGVLENIRQFRFDVSFMNYGDGGGTVSVGGPALYVNRTATLTWASHGYGGPVLIRIRRLDQNGTGTVALQGRMATTPGGPVVGKVVVGGRVVLMSQEADVPVGAGDRSWTAFVGVPSTGCWAVQVDGDSFTELFVFQPRPPAQSPIVVPQPFAVPTPPALTPRWLPAGMQRAPGTVGVSYVDSTNSRSLVIDNGVPNPPPSGTTTSRSFRKDPQAVYHFEGSSRLLSWTEPNGTPYEMRASGLSDDEFWHVAGSLG
jgi:hypothetical protein